MPARTFHDLDDAHAWLRQQFGAWANRPTPQHLEALAWYKTGGSEQINGALRIGAVDRFDTPAHLAITEAIAAETLTEPVFVYRGISDPDVAELVLLHAAEIQHEGFVSVSLLEEVARTFTNASVLTGDEDAANVLLAGVLPIGTAAAPLDFIPDGDNDHEAELLLHAGSAFVINEIDTTATAQTGLITAYGHWRAP